MSLPSWLTRENVNKVTDFLTTLGLGAGGGLAINEAYQNLGEAGTSALSGANEIAQQGLTQTEFKPYTVSTGFGGQVTAGPTGVTSTLGKEQQDIANLMQQRAMGTLSTSPFGQFKGRQAMSSAYGLGQNFMAQAGMPTDAREQSIYSNIRAMQQPEEERQRLGLEERLANQGRLGVRTNMYGGTPEQLAMSKAQAEAQNQASLMAMQQAQAEQLQQANIGAQYAGLGAQLGSRDIQNMAAQQQLGLGFLAGSYAPQNQQAQLMSVYAPYAQMAQRGQLQGAGLFGEASMSGLEALLGSRMGQANLMGQLGTGLLSGLFAQN